MAEEDLPPASRMALSWDCPLPWRVMLMASRETGPTQEPVIKNLLDPGDQQPLLLPSSLPFPPPRPAPPASSGTGALQLSRRSRPQELFQLHLSSVCRKALFLFPEKPSKASP